MAQESVKKNTGECMSDMEKDELNNVQSESGEIAAAADGKVELQNDDLESVTGGTFWFNYFKEHEYNSAGIQVVSHFIEKDEFWWKGQNIGHSGANNVVYFYKNNGREPVSLNEAMLYRERNQEKRDPANPGNCDLVHLG